MNAPMAALPGGTGTMHWACERFEVQGRFGERLLRQVAGVQLTLYVVEIDGMFP